MDHLFKKFSKFEGTRKALQKNAIGTTQEIIGVIYPKDTKEVQEVIKIANKNKVILYPYSKGHNYGYGAKTPLQKALLVDLSKMNKIRMFDNILGKIVIEPGVTQIQLYTFLKETHWMCDVSGAGKNASIVGNCLEGGFGHTPKGNKRKELTNIEVVLGSGEILKTGEFPGLGPDLSGLFVQSNFGVITAIELSLLKKSEVESFIVTFKNTKNMLKGMQKVRTLLQSQTLLSLVHIGNATRTLFTLKTPTIISNKDAATKLKKEFGIGDEWNCLGGIYGTKKEITAKKKILKEQFKQIGKIRFFNAKKIKRLEKIATKLRLHKKKVMIKNLKELHSLIEGKPTDTPLKSMQLEKSSLLWFSPTINAKTKEITLLLEIAEKTLDEFNFSFPLTLTFVTPSKLVGVISLQYQKERMKDAVSCYNKLSEECKKANINQYRKASIGMQDITYEKTKKETLLKLKRLFDPKGIISPGRYNIK